MISAFGYGQPIRLILDNYPRAKFVFSVRLIRNDYLGPCMRIRRSSDNAETDINYLGNKDVNAAAITAFLGGSNGFVVTLYDQSGSGNNATQSTASLQNRVYVNKLNGKVAVGNDSTAIVGARYMLTNSINKAINFYSFVACGSTSSTACNAVAWGNHIQNNQHMWMMRSGASAWLQTGFRTITANTVRNSLLTDVYDNNITNISRHFENTTMIGSMNIGHVANINVLMAAGNSGGMLGVNYAVFSEIMIFNQTEIKPVDVTRLQNDIIGYYGF